MANDDNFALPQSNNIKIFLSQQARKRRKSRAPVLITRNFTVLSPPSSQFYTVPRWTAAGDYNVGDYFRTTVTGYAHNLTGGSLSSRLEVQITNTNQFLVYNSGFIFSGINALPYLDGRLHTWRLQRIGTTVKLYVDEIELGSTTKSTTATIDFLGARDSVPDTRFWNGYLADIFLEEASGDNRFYPIEEPNGATVLVDTLGGQNGVINNAPFSELFTKNTDTTPNQWENTDKSVIMPLVA